jgi:hypothetical protein
VDPPSGRVPIMPWAEERRNYKLAHIQDDWVNFTPWNDVSPWRSGRDLPGRLRLGLSRSCRVPATSRIVYEMIHEARIIPLDGRPHLGGRFPLVERRFEGPLEGNTLVVDITGYNDKGTGRDQRRHAACSSDSAERGTARCRALYARR